MAKRQSPLHPSVRRGPRSAALAPPAPYSPIAQQDPPAAGHADAPQASQATPITEQGLMSSVLLALAPDATEDIRSQAKADIRRYLVQVVAQHSVASKYNVLLMYDTTRMIKTDADSIYAAVTRFPEKRPLLLVLHSDGGSIEAAYLIGKLLREYSGGTLDVVIPRRAKSAATLLCCAADRIHMGSLSELGPIDPQVDRLPVLGLRGAIQHIAELVKEHPHATTMFAEYLSNCVKPIHLGYYERVAESASQYAERLLLPHASGLAQSAGKIGKDLVYSYKDHGFVIDVQEARGIFGLDFVSHNSDEYHLGNALYQGLVFIGRVCEFSDYDFFLIGGLDSDVGFLKRRRGTAAH